MSGDYSGNRFDPTQDFSNLFLQQGRVTLDWEINQLAQIVERRVRAETVDIIGRSAVPRETPNGFQISCTGSGTSRALAIGRGRIYVDGCLAENHGGAPFAFDMASVDANGRMSGVLAEQIGTDTVAFAAQPYLPLAANPTSAGPLLVYARVWNRELTYVEDKNLLEQALGGVDTATRAQTAWQVNYLANVSATVQCSTAEQEQAWQDLIKPSAARLTTTLKPVPDPGDPCLIPPTFGYSGLENQFYRIEIHKSGNPNTVEFKYSRDNASIATNVLAIVGDTLTVPRVGRDQELRFSDGDWLELTDDRRELSQLPGELRRVKFVDDKNRKIQLYPPTSGIYVPADLIPSGSLGDTFADRHTRIRKWDQRGKIYTRSGTQLTELVNLDVLNIYGQTTSSGAISVSLGSTIELEHGIEITFDSAPGGGTFHTGDYWNFAARTADMSIELLTKAPPRGIHNHFARLAVVGADGHVEDCRRIWPADDCCGCTVCVTPKSHESGSLTIQEAIRRVIKRGGGTVCLDIGIYPLRDPLLIDQATSLRLEGQGLGTVLTWGGRTPAITISNSTGVVAEAFTVLTAPQAEGDAEGNTAAFALKTNIGAIVQHCVVVQANAAVSRSAAVSLEGSQTGTQIERNVFITNVGITGPMAADDPADGQPALALFEFSARDNFMACNSRGIYLDQRTIHQGDTQIAGNTILACSESGIECSGTTVIPTRVAISGNLLGVSGTGIVARASATHIMNNDIVAMPGGQGGDGIALYAVQDCEVIGNRVSGKLGAGILMAGAMDSAMIKQNIIRDTGAGIIMTNGSARILAIENNQLSDISKAFSDQNQNQNQVAVRAVNVDQLRISANTVSGLGQSWRAANYAAVDVIACHTVIISANNIADAYPAAFAGTAGAIAARDCTVSVQITDNVIRRGSGAAPAALSSWFAIAVGYTQTQTTTGTTNTAGTTASNQSARISDFFNFIGQAFVVVLHSPPQGPQISVLGNNCNSWASNIPMVLLQWNGATCTFGNNQCQRLDQKNLASTRAEVELTGDNAAVTGNVVRMPQHESPSMKLTGAVNYTVLGNLTSTAILVGTSALPAPWQALNRPCS